MKPKDKETESLFVQLRMTKCAVRSLYNILYVRPYISVSSWILSFMYLLPIWEESCVSVQIMRVKTDLH